MNEAETPEPVETPEAKGRSVVLFAVLAALVVAGIWATVAMAAGGSASSGSSNSNSSNSSSPPAAYSPYAADGIANGDDCPDHQGGGGGGSTTPNSAPAPSAPSQQDGSSNPSL